MRQYVKEFVLGGIGNAGLTQRSQPCKAVWELYSRKREEQVQRMRVRTAGHPNPGVTILDQSLG